MAESNKSLTVRVPSINGGAPHEVTYSPEQLQRMRLANQFWRKTRSIKKVARALGVSYQRAREILDRGSALGLYPKRRGTDASTVHPELPRPPANISQLLTSEMLRLAHRGLKPLITDLRRELARQRGLMAALRREVADLSRDRLILMRDLHRRRIAPAIETSDTPRRVRLGPKLIQAQRRRLGLNKREFGRLLGFSGAVVAKWEVGTKPRARARAALVAVREIGRREARRRLALLAPERSNRTSMRRSTESAPPS